VELVKLESEITTSEEEIVEQIRVLKGTNINDTLATLA